MQICYSTVHRVFYRLFLQRGLIYKYSKSFVTFRTNRSTILYYNLQADKDHFQPLSVDDTDALWVMSF